MEVYIFSDLKNIQKKFSDIGKSKNVVLSILPAADLKKIKRIAPPGSMVYADLSSFGEGEAPGILKFLARLADYRYAIIDPNAISGDIADLFHNGASDYIGKKIFKTGITRNRLLRAMNFQKLECDTEVQKSSRTNYILSGSDWKNIMQGRIYTFCFMFIELDYANEIKFFGMEQFNRVIGSFRSYLEDLVEPINGKIWIWNDFGGLILFPFNGKKCDAIETALMLMINRKLLSAEITQLDIALSYRIAMHIGNTVYKSSGETGTIVSDSINSIFHLGQKFAEAGNLYLTEDIFSLTPDGLIKCFINAGEYEDRHIFRMRRVL
jgi:hypothetical protein